MEEAGTTLTTLKKRVREVLAAAQLALAQQRVMMELMDWAVAVAVRVPMPVPRTRAAMAVMVLS